MFNEINIELTSRCQKKCWICPRWQDGKEKGDIPFPLLQMIEKQLEPNIIIHFHNNGEPLLYPDLSEAMDLFPRQIKHFDTNGILLLEKANDLKKVDIISVSIIENDPIGKDQMLILEKYLHIKPDTQKVIARCVGEIDISRTFVIKTLRIPIVHRVLHHKSGRVNYTKESIKPEDFICRDFLNHPAIDYKGNFYMCVKYDPEGIGILGNLYEKTIEELWYSKKRLEYLDQHISARNEIDFCCNCEYYGLPNA